MSARVPSVGEEGEGTPRGAHQRNHCARGDPVPQPPRTAMQFEFNAIRCHDPTLNLYRPSPGVPERRTEVTEVPTRAGCAVLVVAGHRMGDVLHPVSTSGHTTRGNRNTSHRCTGRTQRERTRESAPDEQVRRGHHLTRARGALQVVEVRIPRRTRNITRHRDHRIAGEGCAVVAAPPTAAPTFPAVPNEKTVTSAAGRFLPYKGHPTPRVGSIGRATLHPAVRPRGGPLFSACEDVGDLYDVRVPVGNAVPGLRPTAPRAYVSRAHDLAHRSDPRVAIRRRR